MPFEKQTSLNRTLLWQIVLIYTVNMMLVRSFMGWRIDRIRFIGRSSGLQYSTPFGGGQIHQSSLSAINSHKEYILKFDGGSRGNPGVGGAGAVLYCREKGIMKEIWSGYSYLGDQGITNNEAEYKSLILGLQQAVSMQCKNLLIEGDSQLIIRQMQGKHLSYKIY